jgi:hypothetical protein
VEQQVLAARLDSPEPMAVNSLEPGGPGPAAARPHFQLLPAYRSFDPARRA